MSRSSERGVALVITLIMLALITTLTIVFLAVSRRERSAVTQRQDLTDAELSAEAAFQRAQADVVAQIMASSNALGFELTVSRSVGTNDFANLFIDPQVPVAVIINRGGTQPLLDDRTFLDLNRNGVHDTNGFNVVGDPEWIGLPARIGEPHGPNNRFIGRLAYIILPVGKALDINFIHNDTYRRPGDPVGYLRNQGMGSWEINFASFLAELNPLVWNTNSAVFNWKSYSYAPFPTPKPFGTAYEDAQRLLDYRYDYNYIPVPLTRSQKSFALLYPQGVMAFENDRIDGYADGSDVNNSVDGAQDPRADNDLATWPWPGADSTHHFFTHQEFFDPNKTGSFATNLQRAIALDSTNVIPNTYYKLLSQLTTDSGPETNNKIHLNYANLGGFHQTNFVSWSNSPALATMFFTNVAERLLRQQFPFGVTNIPVYPTNFYSAAVHRLLQVAANIYDATLTNDLPSVFRPLFRTLPGGIVVISGYIYDDFRPSILANTNAYNIPVVIGAKKYIPNFNEFTLQTSMLVSRKLELVRRDTNSFPTLTNQMYLIGLSNLIGIESWNSYTSFYPRPLDLYIQFSSRGVLSNQYGVVTSFTFGTNVTPTIASFPPERFLIPLHTNSFEVSNSVYRFGPGGSLNRLEPLGYNRFETGVGFPVPNWYLSISNRLLYMLSEGDRIVDYVVLDNLSHDVDLTREILGPGTFSSSELSFVSETWQTNRVGGGGVSAATYGIRSQIDISLGSPALTDAQWGSYNFPNPGGSSKSEAIEAFRKFVYNDTNNHVNSTNMQAPFSPTRKMVKTSSWQANDPLVHYHYDDLIIYPSNTVSQAIIPPNAAIPTNTAISSLGRMNDRFAPWGGNPNKDPTGDPNAYLLSVKDPAVMRSDDWDFPSGKFASIGWLGRVHRGTPWQTIYLKAALADKNNWVRQSFYLNTMPTNDWRIPDLFTIAPDDNASRGLLSINQTNAASWAGVLGGVAILANATPTSELRTNSIVFTNGFIEPNTANLTFLIDSINTWRTNFPGGLFRNLSEFISTPQLTSGRSPIDGSPFLDQDTNQIRYGLNDVAYERIPQQILSLLKIGEPRFVIYAYGQSLKPANNSIRADGVVTNYQVTAEFATRTVLRVEGSVNNPRTVVESFNILPPD